MGDVSILMYILFLVVLGSGIVIVLRTKGKPIPEPEHREPMTFAEKKEMAGFVASTRWPKTLVSNLQALER